MSAVIVSRPSFSSRQLARRIGARRVIVGSRKIPKVNHLINWGCSEIPGVPQGMTIVNHPGAVSQAVDKSITFHRLKEAGVPTVEFTDKQDQARNWLEGGSTIYGRELTRGSGGAGIHLYVAGRAAPKDIGRFPLYTKFFKCDRELRVHVFRDGIIDFSEKRRVNNPPAEVTNRFWIRTYSNGWIYAREGAECPEKVREICIRAIRGVGLDFGAVDLRLRGSGTAAVLEINSAPGITGQTLDSYTTAFRNYLTQR